MTAKEPFFVYCVLLPGKDFQDWQVEARALTPSVSNKYPHKTEGDTLTFLQ